MMRYLTIAVLFLTAWWLIGEFVLTDRKAEGLPTFQAKLADLGGRLHNAVGLLAVALLILLLVRFALQATKLLN
jgi:hypothetical protein